MSLCDSSNHFHCLHAALWEVCVVFHMFYIVYFDEDLSVVVLVNSEKCVDQILFSFSKN